MIGERARLGAGVGCGLVVAASVGWFAPWQLTALAAWDRCAGTVLALTWGTVGRFDSIRTQEFANREDAGREMTRLVLASAAIVSLVGIGFAVMKAKNTPGYLGSVLTTTGVLTVMLSWAVVHTLFTVRYARLYYDGHPGGIDFKSDEPPDIVDFAYVAFTVGMTFQVSDTDIQKRSIRRSIIRHALLSYLFGTVIIALTINVIAGLVK